jgi:hypothetical protein
VDCVRFYVPGQLNPLRESGCSHFLHEMRARLIETVPHAASREPMTTGSHKRNEDPRMSRRSKPR